MGWKDVFDDHLTRGMDVNEDGTVTARWHRIKNGCEMNVSFTLPNKRSMIPLEVWGEFRPIVDEFVLALAYGRGGPVVPGEPIVDAEWREVPELLLDSPDT